MITSLKNLQPRICTVVTGETLEEFLENLKDIQKISDLIELRVDYIKNFNSDDLQVIADHTVNAKSNDKKYIFTLRSSKEGGKFEGNEKERLDMIKNAYQNQFGYVDLELSACKDIDFKSFNRTKTIVSFHNFRVTPNLNRLDQIKNKIKASGADIIKIATFTKSEQDVQNLLRLLINKDKGEEMIVLGMGEVGQITRILSPLLGGYLTFASTESGGSAPGQIDIEQLRRIYNTLSNC